MNIKTADGDRPPVPAKGSFMPSGFLPDKDLDLLGWAKNCRAKIVIDPQRYGLTQTIADDYSVALDEFAEAMSLCNPFNRNKTSVIAKNEKRDVIRKLSRNISRLVQGTVSVNDATKSELGLNVRAPKSKIPRPDLEPHLEVCSVRGYTVSIKLKDKSVAGRRGKPVQTVGASVFSYTGADEAPGDLSKWKFEGNFGKTRLDLHFGSQLAPGTKVFLSAFWFNNKKQAGPLSSPTITYLQGGGVAMTSSIAKAA